MSTIQTTKKITIATLIALSATSISAVAATSSAGWTTTPAAITAAKAGVAQTKADLDKALALVNDPAIRADAGKFSEAAAHFEKARQHYQAAVMAEKSAIKESLGLIRPAQHTATGIATTAAVPAPQPERKVVESPKFLKASTTGVNSEIVNREPGSIQAAGTDGQLVKLEESHTAIVSTADAGKPQREIKGVVEQPHRLTTSVTGVNSEIVNHQPGSIQAAATDGELVKLESSHVVIQNTQEPGKPQREIKGVVEQPHRLTSSTTVFHDVQPGTLTAGTVEPLVRVEESHTGIATTADVGKPQRELKGVVEQPHKLATITTGVIQTTADVPAPQIERTGVVESPRIATTGEQAGARVHPSVADSTRKIVAAQAIPVAGTQQQTTSAASTAAPVNTTNPNPNSQVIVKLNDEIKERKDTEKLVKANIQHLGDVTVRNRQAIDNAMDYTDQAVNVALDYADKVGEQAMTYTDQTVADVQKGVDANKTAIDATDKTVTAETTRATKAEQDLDADKADKAYVDAQDAVIFNQAKANTTQQVTDSANVIGQHIDDEETRAKAAEQKNSDDITLHNSRISTNEHQLMLHNQRMSDLGSDIATETQRATTAESKLATDKADKTDVTTLAGEVAQKEDHADFVADQTRQDKALSTETTRATTAEQANQKATLNNGAQIRQISSQVAAQGAYVQQQNQVVTQHTTAIAQNRSDIATNRSAIKRNSDRIDANSKRIDDLKNDNASVRKEMKAIGNNAAAMSSLHFDANHDSWALSTGSYNADGAAFAGGLQKGVTDHVAVTVQASFDGEGNTMIGAGIHGDY